MNREDIRDIPLRHAAKMTGLTESALRLRSQRGRLETQIHNGVKCISMSQVRELTKHSYIRGIKNHEEYCKRYLEVNGYKVIKEES